MVEKKKSLLVLQNLGYYCKTEIQQRLSYPDQGKAEIVTEEYLESPGFTNTQHDLSQPGHLLLALFGHHKTVPSPL